MMEPCYPLPLKDSVLDELAGNAKDFALTHGIGMRPRRDMWNDSLEFAPFVLLPSPFPSKEFLKAKNAQRVLNELVHKVAHTYEFLKECLKTTIEVDRFTANLFRIYETVYKEGFAQPVSLSIIRADYLLQSADTKIEDVFVQQVEINTIACSFGSLTSQMLILHRYILRELGMKNVEDHIPDNYALRALSEGIVCAWKHYGSVSAVVLFVVEEHTINICDQRMMEFDVREINNTVFVIRRSLEYLADHANVKEKKLFVDGLEVAVVYYRIGYSPDDYTSEKIWDLRLLIERSKAIKCPSINYHLAGTKKIQQELTRPGVLENFLLYTDKVEAVRQLFTGLYSLNPDNGGNAAIKAALKNPSKYVLKPQREGGGNNFYDEDMRSKLLELQFTHERNAYILMDRIIPPHSRNYIIKPGSPPELCEVVSELGVYGIIIGSETAIIINKEAGHLLRTKRDNVNEGGVAAGFGGLDSIYLI